MFQKFHDLLEEKGLVANEGKIIDASFVVYHRQRNIRKENKMTKAGEGKSLWNDNKHKKCHKDIDARWTKKRNETFFGYKNLIKKDHKSKFIDSYMVNDASVHDSKCSSELLTEQDKIRDRLCGGTQDM